MAALPISLLILAGSCQMAQFQGAHLVDMDISAHTPATGVPFDKFWSSTGFSPPDEAAAEAYLLAEEMRLNLAYIGSLPQRALRQVRVHWLLSLVTVAEGEGNDVQWDFGRLDRFLDQLVLNGLRPGFELMGLPAAGGFTDMADPQQAARWRQLVTDCILHCAARYGREEVSSWRFETWNEPDLAQYNTLNWTLNGYLSYLESSVRGVRLAERQLGARLRVGGPAGTFKSRARHPICWGALDHCYRNASNRCDLDFVSFHRKGAGSSQSLVDGTLALLDRISRQYPALGHVPAANDEADPLTGWWRVRRWRGDARYACMAVSAAIEVHRRWARNASASSSLPPLELFSNDHGFLESSGAAQQQQYRFQQRTLVAS